jgi:hypothetical protein
MTSARILVGCELSGMVRDAFLARGFDAWSCDLRASRSPGPHIVGDVRRVIRFGCWHCAIVFPPCQYLSASGLHWNRRDPDRAAKTEAALQLVADLFDADVAMLAIENPRGCIGTRIRPADQSIQPYQFREDASKATMLWLRNLPRLRPTGWVEGREVDGLTRWSNQTDSGQNAEPDSAGRADRRAETYPEVADAMAVQWGDWIRQRVPDAPDPPPRIVPTPPNQLSLFEGAP